MDVRKNNNTEMSTSEENVLAFLKAYHQLVPARFQYLMLYGMKATELKRLIEHPEQLGNKPFVHVCKLHKAIDKINRNLQAHRLAMYRRMKELAA